MGVLVTWSHAHANASFTYSDINVIGYDWKIYDFDTGFYTIDPSATYILSDTEGYFYKLRFIDFYNENGEKGSINIK